jgi:hypothetical protein
MISYSLELLETGDCQASCLGREHLRYPVRYESCQSILELL